MIPALVNGAARTVITERGRRLAILAFTVRRGQIIEIDSIGDPQRVERLAALRSGEGYERLEGCPYDVSVSGKIGCRWNVALRLQGRHHRNLTTWAYFPLAGWGMGASPERWSEMVSTPLSFR